MSRVCQLVASHIQPPRLGFPDRHKLLDMISRVLANLVTFVEAHGQRICRLTVPGG